MLGTRAKGIFEVLKKFLSHGNIWQKVLPQHDLLKSFGTPTIEFKIAQKVLVTFYNFTIVFVPLALSNGKFQRV